MNTNYVQLTKNLEYLKMKQMLLHLDEVIDFINKNELSFVEGLIKLTNYEIDFKEDQHDQVYGKDRSFSTLKRTKRL